jgi:hypothetical protein
MKPKILDRNEEKNNRDAESLRYYTGRIRKALNTARREFIVRLSLQLSRRTGPTYDPDQSASAGDV